MWNLWTWWRKITLFNYRKNVKISLAPYLLLWYNNTAVCGSISSEDINRTHGILLVERWKKWKKESIRLLHERQLQLCNICNQLHQALTSREGLLQCHSFYYIGQQKSARNRWPYWISSIRNTVLNKIAQANGWGILISTASCRTESAFYTTKRILFYILHYEDKVYG